MIDTNLTPPHGGLLDPTLVLALDAKHVTQLQYVLPTWQRYKPEIFNWRLLAIMDRDSLPARSIPWLDEAFTRGVAYYGWAPPHAPEYASQREKMLAAFVHVPPRAVATKWWVKIDTDALATEHADWLNPQWFDGSECYTATDGGGHRKLKRFKPAEPVFVAPGWHYTKVSKGGSPADFDRWADEVEGLSHYRPIGVDCPPDVNRVRHRRICSWVFFCRTDWSKEVADYIDWHGWLPIWSQDGYHFCCAARRGDPWAYYPAKQLGWKNVSRTDKLQIEAERILAMKGEDDE